MSRKKVENRSDPPGFRLRHTLSGHEDMVGRIAWSPDGKTIASPSADRSIRLWDAASGECLGPPLEGHSGAVYSVVWSPSGKRLASASQDKTVRLWDPAQGETVSVLSGHWDTVLEVAWSPNGARVASASEDRTIRLWDPESGELWKELFGHRDEVHGVAWSLDGRLLASASRDWTIRLWDGVSGEPHSILTGHAGAVTNVVWSPPDGQSLASASEDGTIRLWDPHSGRVKHILEGHTGKVINVSFSADGRLLASNALGDPFYLWNVATWERVITVPQRAPITALLGGVAFHPAEPILATLGEGHQVIRIWDLHLNDLLPTPSVFYASAKVVLVGDSGTGKTCLARALAGLPFQPQSSTHGTKVLSLGIEPVDRAGGGRLEGETLLWDFAGQAEYRDVAQLFLDETAVGVVLFNPPRQRDPFSGVGYWARALRRIAGEDCPRLLVLGRADVDTLPAAPEEIEWFRCENDYRKYIPTSAKHDDGIKDLKEAILRAIPWDRLPVITASPLWQEVRGYLLKRQGDGRNAMTTRSQLRRAFKRAHKGVYFSNGAFDAIIRRAEAQGLVWCHPFGEYVLLKPELLNGYAGAVVREARNDPEGLGCVLERDVLYAKIDLEGVERLPREMERSLLYAVVELFLQREVAFRERDRLVFPYRFNRKRPEFPVLPRREVTYSFTGSTDDVYATLVVRLFYSEAFVKKELWKDAGEFQDAAGHTCGISLNHPEEDRSVIDVFFEQTTALESKVLFLQFIHEHLQSRALSLKRERIYRCPHSECGEEVVDQRAVAIALAKGKETIPCLYCEALVPLIDLVEERFGDPALLRQVQDLDEKVVVKKAGAVGVTKFSAAVEQQQFDVFLSYSRKDRETVRAIAEQLRRRGLKPWLDEDEILPGQWWQKSLQDAISAVKSAAIIVGEEMGKWHTAELLSFSQLCVEKDLLVIPVLLRGVTEIPPQLMILKQLQWIDFNAKPEDEEQKPLNKLVQVIKDGGIHR